MDPKALLGSGFLAPFTVAVLAVSLWLLRKAVDRVGPSRPNMVSVVFHLHLLLQTFFCALLVSAGVSGHYLLARVSPLNLLLGWALLCWALLGFPAGVLLVKRVLERRFPKEAHLASLNSEATTIEPVQHDKADAYFAIVFTLSLVCVTALAYTLALTPRIALLELLRGEPVENVLRARISSKYQFGGIEHIRNIFVLTILPFLSLVSFAQLRLGREPRWIALSTALFLCSVIALSYDTQKAPVLTYFASIALVFLFAAKALSLKRLALGGAAFSALLTGVYLLVTQAGLRAGLFSLTSGLPGRVFFTQASGVFLSLEHFPATHSFLGLRSLSGILSRLAGWEHSERSARLLMRSVHPGAVEDGRAGVINSLFIAESYANFGWIGALLSPFYVGIFTGVFFFFVSGRRLTPLTLGLLAFFAMRWPLTGGMNEFLYNPSIVLLLGLAFLIPALAKVLPGRTA